MTPAPKEGFDLDEKEPWEEDFHSDLPLTELGMARRLVLSFNSEARYSHQLVAWFIYDGCRWAEDVTGEVQRRAKTVVDNLHAEARFSGNRREELTRAWLKFQTAARIRSIVELATTEPGVPVLLNEFDADDWSLNVANGVVDLRTGALRPHSSAEMHSKMVPIVFHATSAAPTWEKFLGEVFGDDPDLIQFVHRFAGYSLTGDVREQLLLFGHGSGANGKSTMFGMLRQLAGDYGVPTGPRAVDRWPT